jgi:hypothetical protein
MCKIAEPPNHQIGVLTIWGVSGLLIIFCVDLEISLGMIAGGADLRSFCADHNVTAVAAFPYLHRTLLEDFCSFNIL